MDAKEIIKRVKQIELKINRLTNNLFMGEYHTSFKGRGMIFSEIRPYQYGDDIRAIDWNKTAHFNEPYIKIFEEERELTLFLLVDISASQNFGTRKQFKNETVAEICATLAFAAIKNNDKVGLILYSGEIELFIPPKKGKTHVLRIIRELVEHQPKTTGTDLNKALKFFLNTIKRKAIVFVLSDFSDLNYEKNLKIASKKHDLIGIRVFDEKEQILPNIGLVNMKDYETGDIKLINTSSERVREGYANYYKNITEYYQNSFSTSGARNISIRTDDDYIKALLGFFKKHKAL